MKSHNRILIGFGIVILVIMATSIALVLTVGQQKPALLPENTPEGTVQRYLIAVQDQNYNKAYDYLSFEDSQNKFGPQTRDEWVSMAQSTLREQSWKANLGKVAINGDIASVEVVIDSFRQAGPLENSTYSRTVNFNLKKQDSAWLITSPTDVYIFN